jgi:hypothetical protein
MDRRIFIGALVLQTLATLDIAHAQPAHKVYRIGILGSTPTTENIS